MKYQLRITEIEKDDNYSYNGITVFEDVPENGIATVNEDFFIYAMMKNGTKYAVNYFDDNRDIVKRFKVEEIISPSPEHLQELALEEARIISLDSGYLWNDYGKYRSDLTVLFQDLDQVHFSTCGTNWYVNWKKNDIDIPMGIDWDGEVSYCYGEFFVSRKGTKCFRIDSQGKHVLCMISWGGCFNSSRGIVGTDKHSPLYFHCARSNGGGAGCDYIILPRGYQYRPSEEDVI